MPVLAIALASVASLQVGQRDALAYAAELRESTLRVSITVPPQARANTARLVIPRAIPMGYGQVEYDRFISNVAGVTTAGNVIAASREDGPRFVVTASAASDAIASVSYEIDLSAQEAETFSGGDSSRVRENFVFLLGYSVFGFVLGLEDMPIELQLRVSGEKKTWPVVSTLAPQSTLAKGTLVARAANFYALADSQVIAGPGFSWRLLRGEKPLYLAVYSEGGKDEDIMASLAEEAFGALTRYFDSLPFPHFTLVFQYLKPLSPRHTYGFSMEHLESATFGMVSDAALHTQSAERDRRRFRYNVAHHVAHAWIPKRSYGEGYFPFQWEIAPLIDTIWFSEGFAQWAAADALDAITPADATGVSYKDGVVAVRFRQTLTGMPDFLKRLPLAELSRLASQRYSEDFRTGQTVFSRGGLIADEMDRRIREESRGAKRLRDAFRYFVKWTEREKRAFRTDEIPAIIKEATSVDVRGVIAQGLAPMKER